MSRVGFVLFLIVWELWELWGVELGVVWEMRDGMWNLKWVCVGEEGCGFRVFGVWCLEVGVVGRERRGGGRGEDFSLKGGMGTWLCRRFSKFICYLHEPSLPGKF